MPLPGWVLGMLFSLFPSQSGAGGPVFQPWQLKRADSLEPRPNFADLFPLPSYANPPRPLICGWLVWHPDLETQTAACPVWAARELLALSPESSLAQNVPNVPASLFFSAFCSSGTRCGCWGELEQGAPSRVPRAGCPEQGVGYPGTPPCCSHKPHLCPPPRSSPPKGLRSVSPAADG